MEICIANSNDYKELKMVWHLVFNDSLDFIDNLYASLDAKGYVLKEDKQIKSCLTVFDIGTYNGKIVSEIYAVCTVPTERNQGYASKLIEYVRDEIGNSGKIALVCPADETLISFYKKLHFQEHFYIGKKGTRIINKDVFDVKEYNTLRESFLKDIPHIKLNENFLDFVIRDNLDSPDALEIYTGGNTVQAMIYTDIYIKNKDDTFPYFGFPMK